MKTICPTDPDGLAAAMLERGRMMPIPPGACPVCCNLRMLRQRGDYLWMTCGCIETLPLLEKALVLHRLQVLNEEAREAFEAERDRRQWQARLSEACGRILGVNKPATQAIWMPYGSGDIRLFGPVTVDALDFALLIWEEHPQGELALLVSDTPIPVTDLSHLGALLVEHRFADALEETEVVP